jgi:hypothetical protein
MTIKEIFNSLETNDQKLLLYAFQQDIMQIVKLDNNRFIGVNVVPTSLIIVEEQNGAWSQGVLKCS